MGAGHNGAARELTSRLEAAGHTTETHDYLPMVPWRLGLAIRWIYGFQLARAPKSYAWVHRHSQGHGLFNTITLMFANLARRRVRRLIRHSGADVVVSTYPLATQVLGNLRAEGRSSTPAVAFMTDFDVHGLLVHRHIDLHLAVSEPSARQAESLMGRPSLSTGPMVPAKFGDAAADRGSRRAATRGALGITGDAVVAMTVAGSWGVGDVGLTVRRLTADGTITAMVICGRNAELQATLAAIPGVVALGWRSDMPDLMIAADVLVENAGGLTAFEAFATGLPVISHECIPGHGPANAGAMAAMGVSTWVQVPADLIPAVHRLAARREDVSARQRAAALAVFTADPAALVGALATGDTLCAAAATAGLAAPFALQPARRSLRRTWTRRTRLTVAGTGVSLLLAGSGVAAATSLGVGVAKGQTDHPNSVFVAVRLGEEDFPHGVVAPSLLTSLASTHAVVAVDQELAASDPIALHAIGVAGITVINGGAGGKARSSVLNVDPRQARSDLVSARRCLYGVPGAKPWVFLATRHLSAFDLGTSYVADDVLVRPDLTAQGTHLVAARGAKIILLDGRGISAAELTKRLNTLATQAAAAHLSMDSVLGILRQPH